MDKYNIPNDDGKKFRRNQFMSILKNPEKGYVDGATDYCMLIPYAEECNLDTNHRLWLAFLYGLSYSQTTAMRIFYAFPDLDDIKKKNLQNYWEQNKDTLWFNPDKKYLKNNDQVVPAIASIIKATHKDFEGYFSQFSTFEALYKEIQKNWKYFGPHGAYLFFDALYGLLPELYLDPDKLDWNHSGKTVVEGMAHLCYEDELIDTRDFPLEKYNKKVDFIQEKTGQPKVIIESTLCAFRKFFKGTRYVGYYADRMLEECNAVEDFMPKGIDVWRYRKETIPAELLGEKNGWDGIQKKLCKAWLDRGELR